VENEELRKKIVRIQLDKYLPEAIELYAHITENANDNADEILTLIQPQRITAEMLIEIVSGQKFDQTFLCPLHFISACVQDEDIEEITFKELADKLNKQGF
jgi:hypothetical protein